MAENTKDALEGKFVYVRYVGPKQQKQITWLKGNPIFNSGNNFTCPVGFEDAGKLIARCPDIFAVVKSPEEPLTEKRVAQISPPITPALVTDDEKAEAERKKAFTRGRKNENPQQLFGRKGGGPFGSEVSAKSRIVAIANEAGLRPEQLTTVQTVEGWWLTQKTEEGDTGETDATLPEDMELTAATEGDEPAEE